MPTYRNAEPTTNQLHEHSLINQLLATRGITTKEEMDIFLEPDYDAHRHDPFLLNDMQVAVDRILLAIKKDERIAIYSDYDCDGIPGAVVLHDFFKAINFKNFTNYIPHRHFEGFGLNNGALDKLATDKVALVVTIDCGTANLAAVEHANKLGLEVIVTDHHEAKAELPKAIAIVNPKVGTSYPFTELCGAGVVYKLVEALISAGNFDLKPGWEKWWLDMVGIATVSDMVSLRGENRVLAHFGLSVLRKSRRPGLQKLLKKASANQQFLTEDDIGFAIGPRINAASRMDTPEDAFLMLTTTDEGEAGEYVRHLEKLNNERKGLVASMTKELHKRLKDMTDIPPVLVLGNPSWRPALVGLAANSLASEYNRPVFLWGRDGNGVLKGSCRSNGIVSLINLMDAAADSFSEHGGHHFSGGFSVTDEMIFSLSDKLNEAYETLGEAALTDQEVVIDAELNLEDVTNSFVSELRLLAPFGVDNPKPIFSFLAVKPKSVEMFGKTKEHLKIIFDSPKGRVEAIAFFATPDSYEVKPEVGKDCRMIGQVEESFFMGRRQIRVRILDIL